MQNLKPLASLCSCAGRFVSYLVANPDDRFSCGAAHIISYNGTATNNLSCQLMLVS